MRRLPVAISAILVSVAIAGCGGGDDEGSGAVLNSRAGEPTEEQVLEQAGITAKDGGLTYELPNGCTAAVILTSREAIDLYASAGDEVATNPAGTVGVKVTDDPPCAERFADALKAIK